MQVLNRAMATVLIALFAVSPPAPLFANDGASVVEPADLDRALLDDVAAGADARSAIARLLGRPQVREIAAGLGLDLTRAQSAIATLQHDELEQLAARSVAAEEGLAGGKTVTISLVTLLLIVIIVLLLAD